MFELYHAQIEVIIRWVDHSPPLPAQRNPGCAPWYIMNMGPLRPRRAPAWIRATHSIPLSRKNRRRNPHSFLKKETRERDRETQFFSGKSIFEIQVSSEIPISFIRLQSLIWGFQLQFFFFFFSWYFFFLSFFSLARFPSNELLYQEITFMRDSFSSTRSILP